jgi:hypothetical protein
VTASFAYLLTNASRDYIRHVCHSVGYGSSKRMDLSTSFVNKRQASLGPINEDEDEEADADIFGTSTGPEETYPTFFPPELANALPTAKKSLALLRAAQPNHLLTNGDGSIADIEWLWTEERTDGARDSAGIRDSLLVPTKNECWTSSSAVTRQISHQYKMDIAVFRIFDLEPGAHLKTRAEEQNSSMTSSLSNFLAAFPEDLPPNAPTLSLLTSEVFSPLVRHAASLSSSLLSLILSSSSHLNLCEHLMLLRSFLLLTSQSFKSRLTSALFSDSEDPDPGRDGMTGVRASIRPSRRQPNAFTSSNNQAKSWAIGLASSLTARESWPPGGADLSFHLRTVIVDSLELGYRETDDAETQKSTVGRIRVLEEAEVRLGFAIRDLPVGDGRDRWLNPLCRYFYSTTYNH